MEFAASPPGRDEQPPVRAVARVNLAAIERNVKVIWARLVGGARLCAVVKADGYGHGATAVARAARDAGATCLAVATVTEAVALRSAGIAGPILVMGAISPPEMSLALAAEAEVAAWTTGFVHDLARRTTRPLRVHVKFDTGMGRLGTRDLRHAGDVIQAVLMHGDRLVLAGAMTHFATADSDPEFMSAQLERFRPFVATVRRAAPQAVIHAANSAATLTDAGTHFDLVRCGIALYGCDPMNLDPMVWGLEPALDLFSYVGAVKLAHAGDSTGYGRQFIATRDTWLATVPIGYGDGVRRALTNNCDVLLGGRRYPVVGAVSMDNLTVKLGAGSPVRVGELVTLIGSDGRERTTIEELARRVGTINYEIACGISARVPRVYHRDGVPA